MGYFISKLRQFKDLKIYEANCSCMHPGCQHSLVLEYQKDIGMLCLSIDAEIAARDYSRNRLVNLLERWWMAMQILLFGEIKANYTFYFEGRKAIKDYIKAIEEGSAEIDKAVKAGEFPEEEV